MTDRYTTADLFEELDGKTFFSAYAFEDAVIGLFNEHLRDFPPGYGYRDAIEQAHQSGWLRIEKGQLKVETSKAAA